MRLACLPQHEAPVRGQIQAHRHQDLPGPSAESTSPLPTPTPRPPGLTVRKHAACAYVSSKKRDADAVTDGQEEICDRTGFLS